MDTLSMITLTNAKPGREADLEAWYDHQHIPDLLRLPGVRAATRYRVETPPGPAAVPAWAYALNLEIDADKLDTALSAIKAAAGTPALRVTDALDPATTCRLLLRPVTPRIDSKAP